MSDGVAWDLLNLQNLPECTQLIDFKLITVPRYDSCLGSPCFPVFGFYPCVYSEITVIGLLLSLMRLYLNSNHRKFDYGLKLRRRLFWLTVPLSKSQVCSPFTRGWDNPEHRTGLVAVASLCRRTHQHQWSSALMFGVRRAQLCHSWLNLFCKTSTATWTFGIFRDCIWMLQITLIFQSIGGWARREDRSLPDT